MSPVEKIFTQYNIEVFACQQNIARFQKLLETNIDDAQRRKIIGLLTAEERKLEQLTSRIPPPDNQFSMR